MAAQSLLALTPDAGGRAGTYAYSLEAAALRLPRT